MPTFTIEKHQGGQPCYRVLDPEGTPATVINMFLTYQATCGRSPYTLRSYATGLAHFFTWLLASQINVDDVTRHVVGQYIGPFGQDSPTRALRSARQHDASKKRQPRTINHRLSVLASYFDFRIRQDEDLREGAWHDKKNPISMPERTARHGMVGRDVPRHERTCEFRRRVPRKIHESLAADTAQKLIDAAGSCRDHAILTLLVRTGQRIGNWDDLAGRHGILGMTLADVDQRRRTITVRLKGARDEHRVPVTDDFWPLLQRYLTEERKDANGTPALWLSLRRGRGAPLSYLAFESSLRYISRKVGVHVHAHMFRHALAQGILDVTGNLKVAQDILGHAQITTTADLYMHVDHAAMVKAVAAVKTSFERTVASNPNASAVQPRTYAFPYDQGTIEELEKAATQPRQGEEKSNGA
ncbi:MAG: tyrosine-type recombinase/integrase [Candidatus Acidiferrales bacterium]